jgi:hypothetical protein
MSLGSGPAAHVIVHFRKQSDQQFRISKAVGEA